MKRCLAAFAIVLSTPAHSAPDRISFLLGSEHVNATRDFVEFNPGVFVTWERRFDWTVGAYRNSFGRSTIAGTVAFPFASGEDWQIDLFAGAAWYPEDGRDFLISVGDIVPLAGIQGRWRYVFAQAIPQDGELADLVLSLGLTFPIGGRSVKALRVDIDGKAQARRQLDLRNPF